MKTIIKSIAVTLCLLGMANPKVSASTNQEICKRDGFVCLETLGRETYGNEMSRFQTVRLDLSAAHSNTNGNYVSVVLRNMRTGATDWRSNRIQTLAKSVGTQIRDNSSANVDITNIGKLVPGSDNLYEYTFSSEMEIVSVDGNVDKAMVWLKLKSSECQMAGPSAPSYLQCPDERHPHMIDLGLPSGTKWACCNVGADRPNGYGNLYAWGESARKTDYCLAKYKNVQKSNSQQGL